MTWVAADSSQRLSLAPGEIHLWLTYYDAIDDEELLSSYHALLTEAERTQQARFYFEKDRKRYLVTRALVRTTLSHYAPIAPTEWRFVPNDFGRPEIVNDIRAPLKLVFNVSHTRGLIALAITNDCALGVDVENVVAREVSLDIAHRFFAPDEAEALALLPVERQRDRFFEYWTFKESYIKARGMGLSIPLDRFSFDFPSERDVELAIHAGLDDRADRWRFRQLRPSSEHLIAICSECIDPQMSNLVVRKAVPARDEQTLSLSLSRESK